MNEEVCTQFGVFKLDPLRRQWFIANNALRLRNKEYLLLSYLAKNAGKVVSRTDILEEVWDRNIFCATNTVDVHVSSLRQKIRKHSKNVIIKTVHCIGYIFDKKENLQ